MSLHCKSRTDHERKSVTATNRISDHDIARVRDASPLADLVREHGIELADADNGNLKGLCPFHGEKVPSFHITPPRGPMASFWHCFGCVEGGDVITFVRKLERLSWVEAIEALAKRAGIELHYEQGGLIPGREAVQ
jgi:DNA primase